MSLAEHPSTPRPLPPSAGYGLAALMAVVTTALAIGVESFAPAPNLSMIFVLPVVLAAVLFGLGPALTTAALSVLAYNFFLIEPRYTLRVADPSNVWGLGLLTLVAALVSGVASASRRRAVVAIQAAAQASAIRKLARDLVAEADRAGVAARCALALAELFDGPAMVMLDEGDGRVSQHPAEAGPLAAADLDAARWAMACGLATRGGAYPAGDANFDFWPLRTSRGEKAVVGLRISGGDAGRPEAPERLVDTVIGYLAVALDREAYARQAFEAQVRYAGDKLKSDILAAVSHDLRTPLSTILFTLQSLQRFDTAHDAAARSALLSGAETETQRLRRMVEGLLDMSRIQAGALAPRIADARAVDLIAVAVERSAAALAGRRVIEAGADLALRIDAGLFETALANILENAAKYAPEGSAVEICTGRDGDLGWIEVIDQGPGFGGRAEALFEKFVRGREGDGRPPGMGLGLAIARSFIEAQGGHIAAGDRTDGKGGWVRLSAPLA